MKYISLDLETTCIDPKEPKNILGIAAVLEDTEKPNIPLYELPHFVAAVDPGPTISGSPYALWLNRWIIDGIMNSAKEKRSYILNKDGSRQYPILLNTRYVKYDMREVRRRYDYGTAVEPEEIDVWNCFKRWIVLLGYDLSRDRLNISGKNVGSFDLQFLPLDIANIFRHRVIDPGSIMIDWTARCIDSMDELKKKHMPGSVAVSHDMLEDAWDVISLNRTTYPKLILPPDEEKKS